jgi:hypothetical protein
MCTNQAACIASWARSFLLPHSHLSAAFARRIRLDYDFFAWWPQILLPRMTFTTVFIPCSLLAARLSLPHGYFGYGKGDAAEKDDVQGHTRVEGRVNWWWLQEEDANRDEVKSLGREVVKDAALEVDSVASRHAYTRTRT